MKDVAQIAGQAETYPRLPPGDCDRVFGYGVMGLPFRSGHVLGLRRWTVASFGEPYTSIWHRDPHGRWTFYQTVGSGAGCMRYFGAGVDRLAVGPISLEWSGASQLHIYTVDDGAVDWTVEVGSTPVTRAMSLVGPAVPAPAWRKKPVLSAMSIVAGRALGVGRVKLTGATPNAQSFDANPLRIWYVTASHATVEGTELGPTGPLPEQAHLGDFYFPQVGIFALGRFFVTPQAS